MGGKSKDEKQSGSDEAKEPRSPGAEEQEGSDEAQELRSSGAEEPKEENIDYKDAYLRSVADYDNLKKETVKLRGDYARYAACEVVEQVLPVLDNMKKALEYAPEDESCAKWVEGVALIREQLEKVLNAAGVTAIGAVGDEFDPTVHEALMREKRDGVAADTVAQVVEPGYKMHDKVLRPAKVIVAE